MYAIRSYYAYLTDTRMRDLANFTGFSSDVWAEDDQSDPINGGYPYLKASYNFV